MDTKFSLWKKIMLVVAVVIFSIPVFSFAAVIESTEVGGNWDSPETWLTGLVPTVNDDVTVHPKVKFPNQIQVKSLKLVGGNFAPSNTNIIVDIFEVSKSASLKTYKRRYDISEINITARKFINNGEIIYPAKINIIGDFINNGSIVSESIYNTWYGPEIVVSGDIINNTLFDEYLYISLISNNFNNAYRISGTEKINLILKNNNNGEYHFRGDIDIKRLRINNGINSKIFLDIDRIFSVDDFYAQQSIELPNKNIVIVKEVDNNSKYFIHAPKSDMYFIENETMANVDIVAKNIYVQKNIGWGVGRVHADNIVVKSDVEMNLAWQRQWGSASLELKGRIENHGEIKSIKGTVNIKGILDNYGTIILGKYSNDSNRMILEGELYNHKEAEIKWPVSIKANDIPPLIINKGKIESVILSGDVQLDPLSTLNFPLRGNLLVNSDLEINFKPKLINFVSKNGKVFNIKFKKGIAQSIGNWKDFNLIFDFDAEIINESVELRKSSYFNKIIVGEGSKITVHGNNRNFGDTKSYILGDIINNGEIEFNTNYTSLNSRFFTKIQNNGIITGKTAWAFSDAREFQYIISENKILTEVEKFELENSNMVKKTIDLVPLLSNIGTKYFIHTKVSEEEIQSQKIVNGDIVVGDTNFPDLENSDFPEQVPVPNIPVPGDRTKPVITLNGQQSITLFVGQEYIEEGAMASDDLDGNLTENIEITGTIERSIIGDYIIRYRVSDFSGNTQTAERLVHVIALDTVAPEIFLIGESEIILQAGDVYIESGAEAVDNADGDISLNIVISWSVDTNTTGIYTLTYAVTDNAGNSTQMQRTVRVTGGGTEIGSPGGDDDAEMSSPGGSSGKKSGGGKSKEYVCKDSRASNFSNIGIHKEILCVYEAGNGQLANISEVADGVEESFGDLADYLKEALQGEVIVINAVEEDEKSETEEHIFLLNSTCLNIHSENKTLRKNQTSNEKTEVKKLQNFLKRKGYLNGAVDGAFGAITKTSLKNFQSDNKLYSDGVLGKGTAGWIDKNCSKIQDRWYWKEIADERDREEEEEREKRENPNAEDQDFPAPSVREEEITEEKNNGFLKRAGNKVKDRRESWNQYLGEKKSALCLWSGWCEGIEEEDEERVDITEFEHSNEGEMVGILSRRDFGFKIGTGSFVNKEKSNNQKTYILIHGFRSNPNAWAENMTQLILNKNSNAQILLLDWSDITSQAWVDVIPDNESTWIKIVSNKLSKKLKDWKLKPNNTTIIGHSLGTLLGQELANKTNIEKRIFLDPASGADYKIDTKGTSFAGFRNKGKCFIGINSVSGSYSLLKDCKEKYIFNFNDAGNWLDQHSWTHKTYREMIRNPFYDNMLSPTDKDRTIQFKEFNEKYDNQVVNGLIVTKAEEPENIKYLKTKESNNQFTLYGNTKSNEIECDEEKKCIIYTHTGGDKIIQKSEFNSLIIKDFGLEEDKDVLFIESYEKIYMSYGKLPDTGLGVNIEITYSSWLIFEKTVQVFLEGVSLEEVEGWIDVLNGILPDSYKEDGYTEAHLPSLKLRNPIQIE